MAVFVSGDYADDYYNFEKIRNTFIENKDLFQHADEEYIEDKHYIFSHAGIHKGYVKYAFPDEFDSITEENVVDYFNNAYFTEDPQVINSLGMSSLSFTVWSFNWYALSIASDFSALDL